MCVVVGGPVRELGGATPTNAIARQIRANSDGVASAWRGRYALGIFLNLRL